MIKDEFGSPFTNVGSGVKFRDDYRRFKKIAPFFAKELKDSLSPNQKQTISKDLFIRTFLYLPATILVLLFF
jgi:hypothetical protein